MRRIKTGLLLLITAFLVVAGLFAVPYALERQQETLLDEQRVVAVRETSEEETADEQRRGSLSQDPVSREYLLVTAFSYWSDAEWLVHSPMEGQLNQEEAIGAFRVEIGKLCNLGILPDVFLKAEGEVCNVSARLMTKTYNNTTRMPQQKYGSMWEVSCCLENTFTMTVYMEAVSGTILELEAYQVGLEEMEGWTNVENEDFWEKLGVDTELEVFDSVVLSQLECPYWNRPDEIARRFAQEYLCLPETDWSPVGEEKIGSLVYSLSNVGRIIQKTQLSGASLYGGVMAAIDFSVEGSWSSLMIRTY